MVCIPALQLIGHWWRQIGQSHGLPAEPAAPQLATAAAVAPAMSAEGSWRMDLYLSFPMLNSTCELGTATCNHIIAVIAAQDPLMWCPASQTRMEHLMPVSITYPDSEAREFWHARERSIGAYCNCMQGPGLHTVEARLSILSTTSFRVDNFISWYWRCFENKDCKGMKGSELW